MPYTFGYKSTEEHIAKKQTHYRAGYGEVSGSEYIFNDIRRGYAVHNVDHLKHITVRSDWMTQEESRFMMELFSSPVVLWQKSATLFVPVILDDVSIERLQWDQEDEIRYEVSFSLARKENVIG